MTPYLDPLVFAKALGASLSGQRLYALTPGPDDPADVFDRGRGGVPLVEVIPDPAQGIVLVRLYPVGVVPENPLSSRWVASLALAGRFAEPDTIVRVARAVARRGPRSALRHGHVRRPLLNRTADLAAFACIAGHTDARPAPDDAPRIWASRGIVGVDVPGPDRGVRPDCAQLLLQGGWTHRTAGRAAAGVLAALIDPDAPERSGRRPVV